MKAGGPRCGRTAATHALLANYSTLGYEKKSPSRSLRAYRTSVSVAHMEAWPLACDTDGQTPQSQRRHFSFYIISMCEVVQTFWLKRGWALSKVCLIGWSKMSGKQGSNSLPLAEAANYMSHKQRNISMPIIRTERKNIKEKRLCKYL